MLVAVAWTVTLVAAAGSGWFAGRAAFVPPQPESSPAPQQTYTVVEGTVGAAEELTATVTWPSRPVPASASAGTVTTVDVVSGDTVDVGAVLYTVDLRPVVIAQGAVPAFRDLSVGVNGADVDQLERFLVAQGFFAGPPDGKYTEATARAVRTWQKQRGVADTGVVGLGDVLFTPDLPARIALDPSLVVGAKLTGGETVLHAVDSAPRFVIQVGADQRLTVPESGTEVIVHGAGQDWPAVVTEVSVEEGGLTLLLTGPGGGPVCADACSVVPFTTEELRYSATVETVPLVTGPTVPLAALGTSPDGSLFVTDADGTRITVTLLASDGSRSVIEGVDVGHVISLFAEPAP